MSSKSSRIQSLDALRGIAALVVVLFHYTSKFYADHSIDTPFGAFAFHYGHFGVELFFIISGFVIYFTLLKIKTAKEFIIKRFIRLYPTYWIALLITCVFILLPFNHTIQTPTAKQVVIGLTMMQTAFKVPDIDGAYWSLFQELCFYAFMLGLWYFKQFKNIFIIGLIWLSVSVLNHFYRVGVLELFLNLKYAPLFLSGIFFYEIYVGNHKKENYAMIFLCLLIAMFISKNISGALIVIPSIFALFALFALNKLNLLNASFFLFLGKISYALYLIHQVVGYILIEFCMSTVHITNPFILLCFPLFVSILLAYLITDYFEKPISIFLKKILLV